MYTLFQHDLKFKINVIKIKILNVCGGVLFHNLFPERMLIYRICKKEYMDFIFMLILSISCSFLP